MSKSKKIQINKAHKNTLKSALLDEYDNILKGNKMKNRKTKQTWFMRLALPLAIVGVLVIGTVGVNLQNGQITAQKALAEAQMYYENADQRGRYLYQKAEIKTDIPGEIGDTTDGSLFTETVITERWYDTETDNERTKTTNSNGVILDESLEIDGKFYLKFSEETTPFGGPDQEKLDEINELFEKDENDDGFPDVYSEIGINNWEELEAADLSPAEEDERFRSAGLPEPNTFLKDIPADASPDGLDPYTTKPSEYEAFYSEAGLLNESSPQEQYEQCIAQEEVSRKTSKLNIFYEGKGTLSEYASIFKELAEDDFYTIEEVSWNGRDAFKISFDSPFFGASEEEKLVENLYLARDNYSFIGAESDFPGEESGFSMRIVTEEYSNVPFDTSTEGFDEDLATEGIVYGTEEADEDFSFNCEDILNEQVN